MCGICGILDMRDAPVSPEALAGMTARLSHRGPDDAGVHLDGAVGFGHRRLSVIDLSRGRQPLGNEDGTVWVTYNGEIYNYRGLRPPLERKGHRFATDCDTEIIVHAYEEDGLDCVSQFNGMFAFALWDRAKRLLVLARDRLGVKPLYYGVFDGVFLFASEIKAILAHPAARREIDPDGVADYLLCTSLLDSRTMFRGIRSLAPGSILSVHDGELRLHVYWSMARAALRHAGTSLEESRDAVRGLLDSAVAAQVVSDVPLGTLLSGGLDSSVVSALAAGHVGGRLKTFAMGYDHGATLRPDDIDGCYAKLVARAYHTDHTEFVFQPADYRDAMSRATWHVEKPVDLTSPSLFLLYREVKPNVTVVMSGEGADELFAGYYFFLDRCGLGAPAEFPWAPYLDEVTALLDPAFVARTRCRDRIRTTLSAEMDTFQSDDPLNKLLYLFLKYYLVEMLERLDKTSMAWGVESRVPFLDHHLVEYVLDLPATHKAKPDTNKVVLRTVAADLLPAAVVTRQKRPVPIPVDPKSVWAERNRANALVQAPGSRIAGYFDREKVDDFFRKRNRFAATDNLAIFRTAHALVALDAWHEVFGVTA
jgi:asparagine synthase (glutamine-hydrolysing)